MLFHLSFVGTTLVITFTLFVMGPESGGNKVSFPCLGSETANYNTNIFLFNTEALYGERIGGGKRKRDDERKCGFSSVPI